MQNRLYLLFTLFCFIFVGCSLTPNEMKSAEEIMETYPDSALHILQHIQSVNTMSDKDRALYGLLYFQALDNNNKTLQPDSLIAFSFDYYLDHKANGRLASCYYYKAKLFKTKQRFDDATIAYLKALDLIQDKKENYLLLGKIYADMGDICSIQFNFNEALKKSQESFSYFTKAGDKINASYRTIAIGKVYRNLKNFRKAYYYYRLALTQCTDSLVRGFAFQEIGLNFYGKKKYDTAQFYIKKSLKFPYVGSNYAIRHNTLAELFFIKEQFDSAYKYSNLALKYPSTFYIQRESYRILTNSEYNRGNLKQTSLFMYKYQDYGDSVRKIESQTKISILENVHDTTQTSSKTKQYLVVLAWVIPLILLISSIVVVRLRKRNRDKETKLGKELEEAEVQITKKQSLLVENLKQKIVEIRASQASAYKKATLPQREQMDKDLYINCLHVNDWDAFKKLTNSTFNNIITVLETTSPGLTHKELIWCGLFLLDVPTQDIALILESQTGSLYKLKQRLALKLNLKTTKELDQLLADLSIKK
jgi:tetratricopeptide (TPR) repeat protein